MAGQLEGKVAFITGTARGQGRAHAVKLAREGADIIGIDLADTIPFAPYDSPSLADLAETQRLVEEQGRTAVMKQCDVRDLETMRAIVDEAVATLGGLDIVVGNAGVCVPVLWNETSPELFKSTLDINVGGVWNTVMVGAPHLVRRGGGSVILTSSYAGKKLQPFMIPYTTSKHALVGMTRGFAAELGPHNIRVNSVHPGAVITGMGGPAMMAAIEHTNAANPRLAAMGTPFLPIYAAEPEWIAEAVCFLASDAARWITSEHLSIDGGAQYF